MDLLILGLVIAGNNIANPSTMAELIRFDALRTPHAIDADADAIYVATHDGTFVDPHRPRPPKRDGARLVRVSITNKDDVREIARGDEIASVAVDDGHVYIIERFYDERGTQIVRYGKTGGGRKSLTSIDQTTNGPLLITETEIHWTDSRANRVWRIPKRGGDAKAFEPGLAQPRNLVADRQHLYLTGDGYPVWRMSRRSGTGAVLDEGDGAAYALGVDDKHVFWAAEFGVFRAPIGGGQRERIGAPVQHARQLHVTNTRILIAGGDGLVSLPKTPGGNMDRLALEDVGPFALAAGSQRVFWISSQTSVVGAAIDRPVVRGGTAPLEVVASALRGSAVVVVADGGAFIGGAGPEPLHQWSKEGGTTRVAAAEPGTIVAVAVDSTHVYWSWEGRDPKPGGKRQRIGRVVRAPRRGGPGQLIADDLPRGSRALVLDGDDVFFIDTDHTLTKPSARILRVAKKGGTPQVIVTFAGKPDVLAVDSSHVYFNHPTERSVMRVPREGGGPEPLAQIQATALAIEGELLYILTGARLYRIPKRRADPFVLGVDENSERLLAKAGGRALAIRDGMAFAADPAGYGRPIGKVWQVAITGGIPSELASSLPSPISVAVDATHVYFVNHEKDELLRVRR